MARKNMKSGNNKSSRIRGKTIRTGRASDHGELVDDRVHVFVDDQNLFWGIVNNDYGPAFRIDFGELLLNAARGSDGRSRGVATAYIAGVVPDDDSFWLIAKNQGFKVRRGYLGTKSRSKQDDAYLITEITKTICRSDGPSTIVLVAGDADYGPPLEFAIEEKWRTELAFTSSDFISAALEPCVHEIRQIFPADIEYIRHT